MTLRPGRGAQVILSGDAQTAARGGAAATMTGNVEAMRALIAAGAVPAGNTANGTTSTGAAPADELYGTGLLSLSAASGLTAHAGGGKASALALTAGVNNVATVATAADSVLLPAMVAGDFCIVINSDADDAMQVFGSGTTTINGVAADTGVAQEAGTTAIYVCVAANTVFAGVLANF